MTAGERNLSRRVAAILLAGGSGTRFGADKNKVYVEALGQPLIRYSLDVFAAHPLVDEVILVAREGEKEILESFPCGKPCRIVTGGATRQASVLHGLQATYRRYRTDSRRSAAASAAGDDRSLPGGDGRVSWCYNRSSIQGHDQADGRQRLRHDDDEAGEYLDNPDAAVLQSKHSAGRASAVRRRS